MSTGEPTADDFFDHLYPGVIDMMQARQQMKGGPPWPDELMPTIRVVIAATVAYLANRSRLMGNGDLLSTALAAVVLSSDEVSS